MKKIVIIAALVCGAWQQADAQYVSKVWVPDQKDGTYINPIIHADYSDPDVCAAGDDFYMTASSFGCALRDCPFFIQRIWSTGVWQTMP